MRSQPSSQRDAALSNNAQGYNCIQKLAIIHQVLGKGEDSSIWEADQYALLSSHSPQILWLPLPIPSNSSEHYFSLGLF